MSTEDVVARAKAALEGVTPGPWVWASVNGNIYEKGRLNGDPNGYTEIVWPGQVSCMSHCYGGSSNVSADNPEHDWPFIAAARDLVPELVTEVERLHSWDGLMSLLDEHYPADIFPTMEDRPNRDPGPRIVSLIRHLDAARKGLS